MTTAPDVCTPVVSGAPVLTSLPVAVTLKSSGPAVVPAYRHVKVAGGPPRSVPGMAGVGPVPAPAVAVPPIPKASRTKPTASAAPVFVTVTVTRKPWFVSRGLGYAATKAVSAAGDRIVAECSAPATSTVAAQADPFPDALNTTSPPPVAVKVQVNDCEAYGASVTGPAGAGPVIICTLPAPAVASIAGSTAYTSDPPVFVTVSTTGKIWPMDNPPGIASAAARAPGTRIVVDAGPVDRKSVV